MTDVQTLSIVVASVGVLIAAINSIISSRRAEEQRQLTLETQQHALETRQAQLFMQVHNRWKSREILKAYGQVRYKYQLNDINDLLTKYMPDTNVEAYVDYMSLHTFFEGLGILVKEGLIDIGLVKDLFSERIIWHWENIIGPLIHDIRKTTNDPTQYDHIEYLYNEMKQQIQQASLIS
ncbi:MAG: DUF4760 domain-containing protein [Candidatus Hodarchaeales archaeon]|jgi:hypothetical protein